MTPLRTNPRITTTTHKRRYAPRRIKSSRRASRARVRCVRPRSARRVLLQVANRVPELRGKAHGQHGGGHRGPGSPRRARAAVRADAALRAAQAGRLQGGRAHGDRAHLRRGHLRELPRTREAPRDRGCAVRRDQLRSAIWEPEPPRPFPRRSFSMACSPATRTRAWSSTRPRLPRARSWTRSCGACRAVRRPGFAATATWTSDRSTSAPTSRPRRPPSTRAPPSPWGAARWRRCRTPKRPSDDHDERAPDKPARRRRARRLQPARGRAHRSAATTWGARRLVRYGARPPLSLERLRRLPGGRVAYRLKYVTRGRGKFRVMTGLEFMARLAAIIAPPRYPLVRYAGVLGPRSAWRKDIVPKPRERRPACNGGCGRPAHDDDTARPRAEPKKGEAFPKRRPREAGWTCAPDRRRRRDASRSRPTSSPAPATSSRSRRTCSRCATGIGCSGARSTPPRRGWTGRLSCVAASTWT